MILDILVNIILPIFLLIGAGFVVDRAFKLDMQTLSKLNFYVTVPALVLIKTLDAKLDPSLLGAVVLFTAIHFVLLRLTSRVLFGARTLKRWEVILTMGAIFYNAGNFGLPLAQLAFGSLGTSVVAIIMTVQNFITFTWGLWWMDSGKRDLRQSIAGLVKVPVIWAVIAALMLLSLGIELPAPIRTPLNYLSDGTIPLALLTLGIQLSRSPLVGRLAPLTAVTGMRLLVSPMMAFGLVVVWAAISPGMLDAIQPILIVAAGLPIAVNVYVLAVEYNRDATLASQMVVWTTLLSAVTLTGWLLAVRQ